MVAAGLAKESTAEMADAEAAKGLTGIAFVIKKLFTKEDPQMLHKVAPPSPFSLPRRFPG